MSVEEILPVASGLFLGVLIGLLRPSLRIPVGAVLIIALFYTADLSLPMLVSGP